MVRWWWEWRGERRRARNDRWRLRHFADRAAYRNGVWQLRPDVRRRMGL